jgi:Amidohydrolase family
MWLGTAPSVLRRWGVPFLIAAPFVIVPSAPTAVQQRSGPSSLAFVHVTLIDGTTAVPRPNQTVVVVGDRIEAVGDSPGMKTAGVSRTLDASGKFLIPGLWDAHVHTRYAGIDHLRLMLANGITSARDMGAPWEHFEQIKQWRADISSGRSLGPLLKSAGPLLDGPGSVWSHAAVVSTPAEGRLMVQRLKDRGADFVKVYDRLSRDSFLAIVDEAKRVSLPVAGHVPDVLSVGEVSDAGLRSIEHLDGIALAASTREDELAKLRREGKPIAGAQLDSYSSAKARALAAQLIRNHTTVVPTLVILQARLGMLRKDPETVASDRLRYIPAAYRRGWMAASGGSPENVPKQLPLALEIVGELHRAGVEIVAGTDIVKPFAVPGFSLHDELSLLVKAGLSPSAAIDAATRRPARLVGLQDRGTIERGMVADLVLLDANPLDEIGNTRRIAAVVAAGRLTERAGVQAMLADVERAAAQWMGTPTGR